MTQHSLPEIGLIRQRADLLRQVRRFFDNRDFLEVQPPCLSRDCVIDAYIDPIGVDTKQLKISDELPDQLFLQTSPELAMKRMLAAGAPSIYSIGPVFRSGESGSLHNVEFTMLEWYEVGADMFAAIETLGALVTEILQCDGYDVISYRQMFGDHLRFDPIREPLNTLAELVREIDSELAESIGDDREMMLDVILSHRIQPMLAATRPLIIRNYPIAQAALAKTASDDSQCAARFELIVKGVELANGYDELLDADVLIERAKQSNRVRAESGRQTLNVHSSLVSAMRRGLPPCAGVALGLDRMLMICSGRNSLDQVLPFRIGSA